MVSSTNHTQFLSLPFFYALYALYAFYFLFTISTIPIKLATLSSNAPQGV